ncbi:spaetzle-processing enzyme-like isoform X2 [Ochlerotatus camptorhynchus]|uniref:spaetzle-processing enzyme-like isoform X2 n=1 Tax=Ochlerotatus camptorhynchus TaxID=644619 RepID=UPI0031D6BE8E
MGSKAIGRVFPLLVLFLFFLCLLLPDHQCLAAAVPCGQRQISHMGFILGGKSAREADWPWHAAIFTRQRSGQEAYICGGTVISDNFILTAAHCTVVFREVLPPESFTVKVGLHNKSSPSEHSRTYEIVEVIRNDEFSIDNLKNDIALLRTEEDITFSDYIQPICLWPQERSDLNSVINLPTGGSVVGWGMGDELKPMDILQEARLSVVDYATCLKSKPDHFRRILSNDASNYCAGNPANMTNVCDGDSGGGMYFKLDNAWYIRGLVSAGVRSEILGHCDPQHYVTFTDIPYYLRWIVAHQEVVKKRNLLNLGNCGLDAHNITVDEEDKPVFLQYPWTAILEFKATTSPTVSTICNGALIHPQFVVTVGHCVDSDFKKYKLRSVRLGEYNMKTNPDQEKHSDGKEISTNFQSIDVEKIFIHPNFNKPRYDNNIAILKLKIPADIARPNVKPICIPTVEEYNEGFTISGWKRVGQKAHVLTRDFVMLESADTCKSVYKKMNIETTANHICGTYYQEDLRNCFHFMSGAPMQYVKRADRKNRYFLKGLFSFGFPGCQLNYTDVFTNINKYASWITTIVESQS